MAGKLSELIVDRLIGVNEIFNRIDATALTKLVSPGISDATARVLASIAHEEFPQTWALLPSSIRSDIAHATHPLALEMTKQFVQRLQHDVHRVLDLKAMAIKLAEKNRSKATLIFEEVGHNELLFVERSGLYFGFLFGIAQAGLWTVVTRWYMLAPLGFFVGAVTNYIALAMCFNPKDEIKSCCGKVRLQGVFLRRQAEASERFASLMQELFFNARLLWAEAMEGTRAHEFRSVMYEFVLQFMRERSGAFGEAVGIIFGEARLQKAASRVTDQLLQELPPLLELTYAMQDEALQVQRTLAERLQALDSKKFENVLHSAFQEDEWQLILIGGLLGFGAGAAQGFAYEAAVTSAN